MAGAPHSGAVGRRRALRALRAPKAQAVPGPGAQTP